MKKIIVTIITMAALTQAVHATDSAPSNKTSRQWSYHTKYMDMAKEKAMGRFAILDIVRAEAMPLIELYEDKDTYKSIPELFNNHTVEDWERMCKIKGHRTECVLWPELFDKKQRSWDIQKTENETMLQKLRTVLAKSQGPERTIIFTRMRSCEHHLKAFELLKELVQNEDKLAAPQGNFHEPSKLLPFISEDDLDWSCNQKLQEACAIDCENQGWMLHVVKEESHKAIAVLQAAPTKEEKDADLQKLRQNWKEAHEKEVTGIYDLSPWKVLFQIPERLLTDVNELNIVLDQMGNTIERANIVTKAYNLAYGLHQYMQSKPANQHNRFIANYKKHWWSKVNYEQQYGSEADAKAYLLAVNVLMKKAATFKQNEALSFDLVQEEEEKQHKREMIARMSEEALESDSMQQLLSYFENMDIRATPSIPSSGRETPASGMVTPASVTVTSPFSSEQRPCPQSSPSEFRSSPTDTLSATPAPAAIVKVPPSTAVRIVSTKPNSQN